MAEKVTKETLLLLLENNQSTVKGFIEVLVKSFNDKVTKMENEITDLKLSLEFSQGEITDLKQQVSVLKNTNFSRRLALY